VPNLMVYVPARPLLTGELAGSNVTHYLLSATLMGLGWSVALLLLSSLMFQRRDFT